MKECFLGNRRSLFQSLFLGLATAWIASDVLASTVARGREEGTFYVPGSNVIGSGNITAYASGGTWYSLGGFTFNPVIGGIIGVGSILQGSAQLQLIGKRGLGPVEAHVTVTLPKNDNLRLFGVSLAGDLFLSTTADTISATSDTSKPEFSPFFFPSITADCDVIARIPSLPLKAYISVGFADQPTLLFRYSQLAIKGGLEARLYKHSFFVDGGVGLYKEKPTRLNGMVGDNGFTQGYVWIGPGGRYRLRDRFSIVGSIKFALVQFLKTSKPLTPDLIGLGIRIEAPVYYRETNTEAIRSLVFMEREKTIRAATAGKDVHTKEYFETLHLDLDTISGKRETFDFSAENEKLVKERAAVQEKMDTLEQMLNEIDTP